MSIADVALLEKMEGSMNLATGAVNVMLKKAGEKKGLSVNFEGFQRLVERTKEKYEQIQRDRVWEIMSTTQLDEATLKAVRGDLIPLYECFQRYDVDDSGELDRVEVQRLLLEFGLCSVVQEDEDMVTSIMKKNDVDNTGTISFPEHIKLVADIRKEMKERRKEETLELFKGYDKDNSGQLSMQECSALFAEMGMLPKCQVGQDEIKRLLDEADEDGSGELDFEEFQTLTELVAEKLRALARAREMEFGAKLNFSKKQVNEFRDAFWNIDSEGSGELGINELRTVMNLLHQKVSGDELRELFDEVDQDGSGCIDFTEFLTLMHRYQESGESDADAEATGKKRMSVTFATNPRMSFTAV